MHVVEDRDDYIHPKLALKRAKKFTDANYKRTYSVLNNNCEHFATAVFGMLDGRGWSFQLQKAAKEGSYTRLTSTSRRPSNNSTSSSTFTSLVNWSEKCQVFSSFDFFVADSLLF